MRKKARGALPRSFLAAQRALTPWRELANRRGIRLTEFLPDYRRFGRGAPLKRNESIAEYADCAIAFWDGKSSGTAHTVKLFEGLGKPVKIILITPDENKIR